MPAVTIPASVTSRPHFMPAGSIVKVSPAAGASAIVEYTSTGAAGIANGVATWSPWPKGTVTAEISDQANNAMHVRVTAAGGAVTLDWNVDPSVGDKAVFRADWRGNPTEIPAPDGRILVPAKGGIAGGLRLMSGCGNLTSTGAGTGVGVLFDSQHPALGDFYAVRLMYANFDTANPMVIDKAKVAPSPVHLTAGGNTLAWSAQVTFNGSTTGSVPVATLASGDASHPVPGILVSDIVTVASIPRTDGGTVPLLRVRSHVPDNVYPLQLGGAAMAAWNAASFVNGMQYGCYAPNDTAANLETKTSSVLQGGGSFEPVGVIFYYSRPTKHLAAFGDSITQGAGTPTTWGGWPARMVTDNLAVSGASVIISASNFGVSGQKMADSHATARQYCAQYKPDWAAICAWSPNDPAASQAVMDACWASTLSTIDYLLKLGITPIVSTSPVVSSDSQAAKDRVLAQNVRVRALPRCVVVVDAASVLSPGGVNVAAWFTDATHPNDIGEALWGGLAYAAIK